MSLLDLLTAILQRSKEGSVIVKTLVDYSRASDEALPVITDEEALACIHRLAVLLEDMRTAIDEVSKGEIEEIVKLILPLARTFTAVMQTGAAGLHSRVAKRSRQPIIEDLDSGEVPASFGEVHIHFLRPRRYLWHPLWPKLRDHIWPQAAAAYPSLVEMACERPVVAFVTVLACTPSALSVASNAALVLCADAVLQRAFRWKGPEVEEALECYARSTRLSFKCTRFVAHQSFYVLWAQAARSLDGRSPSKVAWEAALALRTDPVGSVATAAHGLAGVTQWAGGKLVRLAAWLPKVPRF